MPAVSEAQRRYIYAHFGADFARRHHFDNPGRLPARKKKGKKRHAEVDAIVRHLKAM